MGIPRGHPITVFTKIISRSYVANTCPNKRTLVHIPLVRLSVFKIAPLQMECFFASFARGLVLSKRPVVEEMDGYEALSKVG
jgi:hypothetical protein